MKIIKHSLTPTWVIFTLIFIVSAVLRLYKLQEFAIFLGDQGRDAIIIKRIATFEHLTAIGAPSSIGQVFLGPFYYYLVAPFLPLFHYHPVGLTFAVAFYSLFGIILSFIIIKKEVNSVTAILFSTLLTFSSVNIDLARYSWNPNLLPVFAFFTLYFWYKTLTLSRWYYPLLFGILFSCSFQLHHLALLLAIPICISIVIHLKRNKFSRKVAEDIGISVIGFGLFSAPLILFDLKNHFLNTLNLIKTFTQGGIITDSTGHTSIINRLLETVTALSRHILNFSIPSPAAVLLFLLFSIGSIFFYKKIKNEFIRICILNSIAFPLAFGLLNSGRFPHYYATMYYSIFLVVAYMLSFLLKGKILGKLIVYTVLVSYIALNAVSYYYFYREPNNQMRDAETIANSIIPHIKKTPFQLVPLPITVTDGNVRYFLEIKNHRPLDVDSPVEGEELYVMCFNDDPCKIFGNPQWQIAAFKNQKVDTMWKSSHVTIYKLVHAK